MCEDSIADEEARWIGSCCRTAHRMLEGVLPKDHGPTEMSPYQVLNKYSFSAGKNK